MSNPSKLRVLMVTLFPETDEEVVGGVAGVAYYLCQHLKDYVDFEVEVLVPKSNFDELTARVIGGIKVSFLPCVEEPGFLRFMYRRNAKLVAEFARENNFDLVHMQGLSELMPFIDIPLVLTIHGINEQDMLFRGNYALRRLMYPMVRSMEQFKRRKAQNLIVISPYVLDAIGKKTIARTWNIENPVRSDFFSMNREPKRNSILFAGILSPRKNVDGLIKAMALVHERIPDASLRIAGSFRNQSYSDHCKSLVTELQLQESVRFLGSLKVHEMQQELKTAHVLSLCSFQETAPLIIEEAMAAGVPVVSSRRCGMPFMIEEGVTGELVDPSSHQSIASGLVRALNLNLKNVEAVSKEIANRRFRGDVVAAQTIRVYREVVESSSRL